MLHHFAAILWVARLWTRDQIGLEASPEEYVAELVAVFREVRQGVARRWNAVAEHRGQLRAVNQQKHDRR